jgi:predicted dehydrogenase
MPQTELFSDIDDLLTSRSVTFVDITTPPAAHCALILKAVEAGIHVICEKPFVIGLEELCRIDEARRSGGPIIAACHNWYFAPAIRRALGLVAAGKIGEPQRVFFAARRSRPAEGAEYWKPTWREFTREGGGILADLGYHGFYLASRVFGSAPNLVLANSDHINGSEGKAESAAYVQLDYGDGKQAEITLSWISTIRETLFQVHGSRGSLSLQGETLTLKAFGKDDEEENFESLTVDSWHSAWIGHTLDWFVEAIRNDDRDACWREIQWTVSALQAARDSMKSGIAVAFPPLASAASTQRKGRSIGST